MLAASSIDRLRERLDALAARCGAFPEQQLTAPYLRLLAQGPRSGVARLLVLGEKGRGKTSLINRLVKTEVLPTGRKGHPHPVTLSRGISWSVVSPDIVKLDPSHFPCSLEGFAGPVSLEGPSDILEMAELIDTPPLNALENSFEEHLVDQVLRADVIVVCLSAEQLLSDSERAMIRQRIAPLTAAPIVLVVTSMDRIDYAEDRTDIERRIGNYVRRFEQGEARMVLLANAPGDVVLPEPTLDALVHAAASNVNARRQVTWLRQVMTLIGEVEQRIDPLEPRDVPPRSLDECLEELERGLEGAHREALSTARARLRVGFAGLRRDLSSTLRSLSEDELRHEARARLIGAVQKIGREVAAEYVRQLELGLAPEKAEPLQSVARTLKRRPTPPLSPSDENPVLSTRNRRPTNARSIALASVGALMFVTGTFTSPLVSLGGALALFGSRKVRDMQQEAFLGRLREDAIGAVSNWLDEAERDMENQLKRSARDLKAELKANLAEAFRRDSRVSSAAVPDRLDFQRNVIEIRKELQVHLSSTGME